MFAVDNPDVVRANEEIDRARLSSYLRSEIEGLDGEMELFQFHAGHSNLTYLVKFGPREFVLKRAPPGHKAKSAHDMGREFHILSRLHEHYPFAPKALAFCASTDVAGSEFCVMERSNGIIIRREYPEGVTGPQIGLQFDHLIDAMTDLHCLDVAAVGLGDFGRPEGYRRRQLEGWAKRFDAARTDDAVDFDGVKAWLIENIPREPEIPAVVHNDFKLDNLVWEPDNITQVKTVLDWEMSTVGDGFMDLACTMSFWVQPDDPAEFRTLRAMPSAHPDVMSRREALQRYAARTGRPIPSVDFLLCFGFFRRAVIEQQKYFRYRQGQSSDARFANLNVAIQTLRDMCSNVIRGEISS